MEDDVHNSIIAISTEPDGEKALKILYLSAYFAFAKSMHMDMFLCLLNENEEELDSAISLLQQKSLVELYKKWTFVIKKSVQREIRTFLKQNGKERDVLTEAIDLQIFHLMKNDIHPNYIDHALALLTHVRNFNELVEASLPLPNLIVTALTKQNRLGEAYVFAKEALKYLKETVGECHTATLSLQHNFATVLDAKGEYAKAIKVFQDLNEKDLNYSTTEEITKSLIVYTRQLSELCKYEEALPLYQILLGEKTVLDTDDNDLLTAWQDYAVLLGELGRHSEAIDILQDLLFHFTRPALTPDYQKVLKIRRTMAFVFQAQKEYVPAMKQLNEALYENKKHFGEYDTETLRLERDIGTLLLHKGDYKEALKILVDVEKKFKKFFDDFHPDILCTRANIVGALMNLNEYKRALRISEDVYEAYKNTLGEEHNETLTVKYNIGAIFMKQKKFHKGIRILQNVYDGFCKVFGPEHEKTVEVRSCLEISGCFSITLHAAAENGDFIKVVSLIENNADVNEEDNEGRRPLHYAASNGHISVSKYLLKMGAMYNAEDHKSTTPYQLATDVSMKDFLNSAHNLFKDVKKGIQINFASQKELINVRDKNGYSLLHWAVCNSHRDIVQKLLDAGADPKCASLKGNTPLHVASSKGFQEIGEVLMQSVVGNDLNDLVNSKTAEGGNTALHVATKNNNLDMVKTLLKYGAIYDIPNKDGQAPVQLSTDQSTIDLLKVTREMFSSVRDGEPEALTQLKSMNCEERSIITKARNSQRYTLLQVAIKNHHENMIKEILEILDNLKHSK